MSRTAGWPADDPTAAVCHGPVSFAMVDGHLRAGVQAGGSVEADVAAAGAQSVGTAAAACQAAVSWVEYALVAALRQAGALPEAEVALLWGAS